MPLLTLRDIGHVSQLVLLLNSCGNNSNPLQTTPVSSPTSCPLLVEGNIFATLRSQKALQHSVLSPVSNKSTRKMSKSTSKSESLADVGLYGMGVMGQNFALNMASHGFNVSVSNRAASPTRVDAAVKKAVDEGNLPLRGYKDSQSFVKSLSKPRKIIILVPAGVAVDQTIESLSEHMEAGDILVDGGNEWYINSVRREKTLALKGMHFIGMGISGGEEGARNGPSLMVGGAHEQYVHLEPIFSKCAAQVGDSTCCAHLGPIGSGNYVKMVHNGIEYGDMQLIAETYDILSQLAGQSNPQMAAIFDSWNSGELESFLIDITATILRKKDDQPSLGSVTDSWTDTRASEARYLVDVISDQTGMKGTGKWTVQEAAERSVPAPTIAAALDARYLSGRKEERLAASLILEGPSIIPQVEASQIIEDCRDALYAAKICSYAQGMCLIQAASNQESWNIDLAECSRIWRGGCIIRASFLESIQAAYTKNPKLTNLLLDPYFVTEINRRQNSWRRIVSLCIASGISCPALSSSLAYYDSYRRAHSPANLTQAQRDFFGAHTYNRTDRSGTFHTEWTAGIKAHK